MTSRVTPLCCHHSVEKCKQSTKLFTPNLTITNFICLWHITLVTSLNYCKLSCAKTLNRVFHGFTIYTKSIPKVFNRIWCPIDTVLCVPFREMFFAVTHNCDHSIPHISHILFGLPLLCVSAYKEEVFNMYTQILQDGKYVNFYLIMVIYNTTSNL